MYILMALPVFFILIGCEYVLSLFQRRELYRLNDSVNDLSMGMIDQVGGAFFGTILFAGYLYVWDHWRLSSMGASGMWDTHVALWVWVACFFAKDLMYYWAHRMSHEMNVGWATHIPHHSSEEFNLTVALRQGVFQGFFFWIFYIPLAFVGFPPAVFILCSSINTIYQFWIHTRAIGKLGPVEWIMNTPSHHRVHHGRDIKYIDRNHAGVFIIWDRLFGTFQEEEEEPNYGLVTPLASWNPIWGQVHYLVKLARMTRQAPTLRDKIRVWYKEPAWQWHGADVGISSHELWTKGELKKYDTHTPRGLNWYVLAQFVPILLLTVGFLRSEHNMEWLQRTADAGMVFWTLVCIGGIFESRRWALYAEVLRIIALSTSLAVWGGALFGFPELHGLAFSAAILLIAAAELFWFTRYRKQLGAPRVHAPAIEPVPELLLAEQQMEHT